MMETPSHVFVLILDGMGQKGIIMFWLWIFWDHPWKTYLIFANVDFH